MSIATEINKLRDRQESIIQQINNKGVSLPSGSSLAACATAISQIQTGGGGTSFTGHVDRVGLAAIGWTEEDIDFYQAHGVNWNEEQDNLHLVSDYNKALYANATKTTYEGVEMADSSYFSTFKNDYRCRFFPKVDTHAITSVSFSGCKHINAIPKLNVSVTSMANMFSSCYSLTSLDFSGFDTSSVTNMQSMFSNCYSLTSLDFSGFDTSSVTNMQTMFSSCYSLTSLDFSGFDTSSVTNMQTMFGNCYSLTSLDFSGFDTSSVTNMNNMFSGCYSLTSLDLGDSFKYESISSTSYNPFNSSAASIIWCGDYNSVKSVLSSFNRTTTSLAFSISFASGSNVKDDSNGTLAALKAACEAKGFTISNLTIEAAA